MRFEPLRYEHLSQMALIESEAFDMPWSVPMFIPEVENPNAVYVVGTRGDEVVCYGGFHKVEDEAHITNIAVKREYRGQGLGSMMFGELLSRARLAGVRYVTLEVRVDNEAAINLYRSYGFKAEGIRKKYYLNKYDALIMWLDFGEESERVKPS